MSLTQEKKQEIIGLYQIHETDTGSSALQVALLSARISQLTEHLKINKKRSFLSSWIVKINWSKKTFIRLH